MQHLLWTSKFSCHCFSELWFGIRSIAISHTAGKEPDPCKVLIKNAIHVGLFTKQNQYNVYYCNVCVVAGGAASLS